jgi:hypothetical protein
LTIHCYIYRRDHDVTQFESSSAQLRYVIKPPSTKLKLIKPATLTSAQYGPGGQYGPGSAGGGGNNNNNPFSSGNGNGGNGNNDFSNSGGFNVNSYLTGRQGILIAHGVLASLAFVIFFPLGAILIRLASSPRLWLIHGVFQIFAYLLYTAAFGIGIYIVNSVPRANLLNRYHPIIGIIVFCLLAFQPVLGLLHHFKFKKYQRRTVWSYGHLWLGRIGITLGMINGGLGLLLATETGFYVPSRGQIVAYGVVAGLMWGAWVVAVVVGERRRARARSVAQETAEPYKEQYA